MSTKIYICYFCRNEFEKEQDAMNCCPPVEKWMCDNCNKKYNDKHNADLCCLEFN